MAIWPDEDAHAGEGRWYRLAADQGDAEAQNNLGNMYETGRGTVQSDAEAAKWYRLAASQGVAAAQYNLGIWAPGHNLRIEVRWAGDNVDRERMFAKELVGTQPDVILAFGTPVTVALKRETRTIPIVSASVADQLAKDLLRACPIRAGISPGSNIQMPQ